MKTFPLIPIVTFIATLLSLAMPAKAEDTLSDYDRSQLRTAIFFIDQGDYDLAIETLDSLLLRNPDNYIFIYELGYAHLLRGDYRKTIELVSPLQYHPEVKPEIYNLIAGAYDMLEMPDSAIAVYDRGIARFPDSGNLLMEKGTTYLRMGDHIAQGLMCYEQAIKAQPSYTSPYYRAARIYLMSENTVWGFIYAETHILLSRDDNRNAELARLMADVFAERITTEDNKIRVRLIADNRLVTTNPNQLLPFQLGYELSYSTGAIAAIENGWSIATLTELRRHAVENYLKSFATITGDLSLITYLKSIIDAGHWEAYNHYVFGSVFPDELRTWYDIDTNRAAMDSFIDWFNDGHQLTLDHDNNVSRLIVEDL